MAYKVLDTAQQRRRRFNGHELVAEVLAGRFNDGVRVNDNDSNNDMADEKGAA